VQRVLEVCWSGVWSDPKLKRTLKFFQIMRLYDCTIPEDNNPKHIPAELIHHFLLAICTCPGVGICFKDYDWHPHNSEGGGDGPLNDDGGDEPACQKGG
jgi:nucleolar pre-ribosomal-associated protein 1